MKKPKAKHRIVRRHIDSLKPHPSQAEIFDDLNDAELQCLADDLNNNGLDHPVEILSDGTIIVGHQRVRAAQLLGWVEIRCWIREDLEQQGEAAVEARLIEDNFNRRQLSRLAVARCYLRLKELERNGRNTLEDTEGDVRDRLGERFDLSGRQLDRYARMLDAPLVVQYAFERNELTQSQVLAVTKLEADEQQEIAQCIESGEVPQEVVKPFMQRVEAIAVSAETVVLRLARSLRKAEQQLQHRFDEIPGLKLRPQVDGLKGGARFLQRLHESLVIDEDQGMSAKHAAGREGFQKLAAEVGLGKVGLVAGYEVSRLSRNCADWHQLLDLCALFGTLIADIDGIYDPRDFNDRLLLGLKGTMWGASGFVDSTTP